MTTTTKVCVLAPSDICISQYIINTPLLVVGTSLCTDLETSHELLFLSSPNRVRQHLRFLVLLGLSPHLVACHHLRLSVRLGFVGIEQREHFI